MCELVRGDMGYESGNDGATRLDRRSLTHHRQPRVQQTQALNPYENKAANSRGKHQKTKDSNATSISGKPSNHQNIRLPSQRKWVLMSC